MSPIIRMMVIASTLIACGGDETTETTVDPPPTREGPMSCDPARSRPAGGPVTAGGSCSSDADCTARTSGRCINTLGGGCCSYDGCYVDADCGPGRACVCGIGPLDQNRCVQADCQTSEDCAGGYCTFSHGTGYDVPEPPEGFFCWSEAAACFPNQECPGDGRSIAVGATGVCEWHRGGWRCLGRGADGTPFCG